MIYLKEKLMSVKFFKKMTVQGMFDGSKIFN